MTAHLRSSRWTIPLAVAAVTGVVLRVVVYRSQLGVPNSDEAVVGLMTEHILQGHFTTFYWGQNYGGPQEALLTAPIFWLFGPSWAALRVVPMLLSGVASLVLWRVALRLVGDPGAKAAGALAWIWPPFVVFELTRQLGFYGSDLLYCALILLLALRAVERPDAMRVGTFGLVLGLAFWQTAQIVPIAAPVIAWTIWRAPRTLRHLPLATAAAALGAFPWLIWNLGHGFNSLTQEHEHSTYLSRLRLFASPLLPMIGGIRVPFTQAPLVGPGALADLVYAILLGLFVTLAVRSFRRRATANTSLLVVVAVTFPFVYAISPQTLEPSDPRYLVVLTPILVLLVCHLATTYRRALAVLALGALVSIAVLHRMDENTSAPRVTVAPRDLRPLVSTLDRLRLDHVYGDYWLVYALDFDTHERIVAAEDETSPTDLVRDTAPSIPSHVRWPAYSVAVAHAARQGYLFFKTGVESEPLVPTLERLGYQRHDVGSIVVFAPQS